MQYLKQSTAATLKIGPFLDDTDGKTAETGLTIAQADVRLSKNGGNIAQKTEATSCTHDELGIYGCPIDVTDTATLGRLQVWVHESGALPVWHEYTVLPANVYDSLFSTDKLQVDLLQMSGVAQSATDLKDFADAGYDPATSKIEGCKVNDDMRGTDSANTTVPDAAGVAPTAAEIKTEVEQAGSSLAQILTDTGELQTDWVNGGRLDLLLDAIPTTAMRGTDSAALASVCTEGRLAELAAANLPADIDAILADVTGINGDAMRGTNSAALASVCTEARLTELAAANLPTDIDAILADVTGINGDAMRGTNNAALASVCTEARLAELAAANLPADVDAILADTGTDGVVIASGSKTGYALSAAGVDAIIDEVVEGSLTLRQMLRLIKAATAGKSAGGGTATLTFRDVADSKNRISATVDTNGNRTAITVDGT